MSGQVELSPASVEAIARRLAELLGAEELASPRRLVDAAELARMLGVSRDCVYANADALGAVRLGPGPKPRLRFDPERARAAMTSCPPSRSTEPAPSPAPAPKGRPRRRRPAGTEAPLVPIRGRQS